MSGVPSSLKALEILEALADHSRSHTLSDIATATGLHRPTVYRFLQDMATQGYVHRDEQKRYRLGYRFFGLCAALMEGLQVRTIARPFLERLVAVTGETVHLVQRDDGEAIYVDKVDSPHPVGLLSHVGKRNPLHCTGVGKVLLAYSATELVERILGNQGLPRFTPTTVTDPHKFAEQLKRIRHQGYALDDGEHREGIQCVACPVFDATGRVAAAVSIAGPSFRFQPDRARGLAPFLKETCENISRQCGFRGPYPGNPTQGGTANDGTV